MADGVLMTGELTMLIGPAEALPAKAVAATATHIAVITLDLICLYIAISFLRSRAAELGFPRRTHMMSAGPEIPNRRRIALPSSARHAPVTANSGDANDASDDNDASDGSSGNDDSNDSGDGSSNDAIYDNSVGDNSIYTTKTFRYD